jgi:hypothetical protein
MAAPVLAFGMMVVWAVLEGLLFRGLVPGLLRNYRPGWLSGDRHLLCFGVFHFNPLRAERLFSDCCWAGSTTASLTVAVHGTAFPVLQPCSGPRPPVLALLDLFGSRWGLCQTVLGDGLNSALFWRVYRHFTGGQLNGRPGRRCARNNKLKLRMVQKNTALEACPGLVPCFINAELAY